jgi:hypothetical protein
VFYNIESFPDCGSVWYKCVNAGCGMEMQLAQRVFYIQVAQFYGSRPAGGKMQERHDHESSLNVCIHTERAVGGVDVTW